MKTVPPLKPHFFKHILAGFNTGGIQIPTSFSKYILGPEETSYPDEALLKKNGKEWRVNVVNEHFVGDGWRRFAEENELKSGGFIVFEHQGNMVFNALIFHPITQCGKEDLSAVNPIHFTSTIKPYNINCHLGIPLRFVKSSGLENRSCKITVRDEKERSWCMDFKSIGSKSRIRRGCRNTMKLFFTANGFKAGDPFRLELVSAGNGDHDISPVVRITPCMELPENRGCKRGDDDSSPVVRFTACMELPENRACKRRRMMERLNIPMEFARSNGLFGKREMILMNGRGRGRRWPDPTHFCITKGWREFRDDNGIKEGDAFKFEIVGNGAVPVARFTVMVPGNVGSG